MSAAGPTQADRTALIAPDLALAESWLDCVREFESDVVATGEPLAFALHGSPAWRVEGFDADLPSLDAVLAAGRQEADPAGVLPDGLVPCDSFWIIDPSLPTVVLGFGAVRHRLDTDFLRTEGGHIGYAIRPSARRQGHAGRALRLLLAHAATLGIEQTLLTCRHDNVASARTIERAGGEYDGDVADKRRYWISTNT
ncbi:GNAT family N-acetyltransferase [Nocardioides sp.]|uniref:GNAT family N-acetyltransferase n=1 Tax=Nocardioides sp. TaxID=35761 RepID=UPI0026254693|nr:GNAT family N-acetyltransferase [Nocardioides sp.]